MLDSLHIKNYRCLKELKIPSLARVCLLTGRNNTGKSTILEAVAIYASRGRFDFIRNLLKQHGEEVTKGNFNGNSLEDDIKILSSLFTDRPTRLDENEDIFIGDHDVSEKEISVEAKFVSLGIEVDEQYGNVIFFAVSNGLKLHTNLARGNVLAFNAGTYAADNFQFVSPRDIVTETNGALFDKVMMADKKQYVVEALQIIEPLTVDIHFPGDTPPRKPYIKLSNLPGFLPLLSMGDGINRILTIILAAVNAAGGFLLIDEFENGLHYSAQEKLWEIIFHLAKKLDIQVFVTTHSEDCIRGFQYVLNNSDSPRDGKLIRLDKKKDAIRLVEYNAEEMQTANNHHIEMR